MKPTATVLCLLLLLAATFWAFESATPRYHEDADVPAAEFSTDRAMEHVVAIARKPHGVGFPGHDDVREYLVRTLRGMGLEPELQEGYTAGDWGNLSKAVNILARIPGTGSGKALLLLSHYDSSPHSSFGASDAGSGVAVILEAVRAYRESGEQPANDIILLFSDAEELGLNGADLFVNQHPWAQDVGLVLNFEARGSGGPGYMLLETNGGNSGLVDAFVAAGAEYPVANSLAYSIYKMLPNDTDLTVFREDGDIEGMNFAFIDDHFDYHTALDTPERLDLRTLAHQGSYLVPLLEHFSQTSLDGLKSGEDSVYFNLPFFGLVTYPFRWIWPIFGLAVLGFLLVCAIGLRNGQLHGRGILKGFAPLFACPILNGAAGYFAWPLLKTLYPGYGDILQGFPYNGYLYIAAWAALAAGICFLVYSRFRKLPPADTLVAPLLLWLVLCGVLNIYLPGAAFFLIPGIALLMALLISCLKESPNPYVLCLLGIPALWIFAPFVKMFPVGLGMKMLIAASLMTTFLFLLLLGLLARLPNKARLGGLGLLLFAGFLAGAHFSSRYTPENPKPTSLLYVGQTDTQQAFWATYEQVPSDWTQAYLGPEPERPETAGLHTLSSKYNSGFTFIREASRKPIPEPAVEILTDTLIGGRHHLVLEVIPQRDINRLEVFATGAELSAARVNGVELSEDYLDRRRGGKLVTHYVSDNAPTRLDLEFPAGEALELTLYEASNDLLDNPWFSIPPRPAETIPMPFILNDAVLLIKSLHFE
ncbi:MULTISPECIES: M20/M25/M40 family metallo-hydrolase [unclassified Robiginitalea]|uniref:M20/M25/M40 family metallo-hydrolase n=1 Tax=Robiginitalea TaxID=252306 RepID=UPI00234983B9|nr:MULTISPECIES: M20/M25/M40 family metallo-hydrolase [unclassified Robiginitalea]MDC6353456.1 M20/M25/M40 family metallo-hydrolase [Robiginitalea sp. PM2]MDC6373379.1 M20/M25/M40 family metallo-hydrolase [Robiginitalea sp. SP8]